MKLLLLLIAVCYSTACYSQASWTYRVGFALNDRNGKPLYRQDFTSGRYQLFTSKSHGTFEYVETLGLFCLSGSAIWPGMHISLTNGRDSTVVFLPIVSQRTILTNWPTKPGVYVLRLDSGKTNHPEAIQGSTRFMSDGRLLSLTVLDWSKYLISQSDGKQKVHFQQRYKVKL